MFSIQFCCSVMSDSLWPHGLRHARPPCPSPTPGIYSNSCSLSRCCHPTISSSIVPSPPALNFYQHQGLFKWVFSIQPQSFQWIFRADSFRMDWLDLLAVQGTLKSLLQHHSSKALILWCSAFFIVQLSHLYMTTGKTIALTRHTFVDRCFKALQLQFFLVTSQLLVFDSSCCGYKIFLNDCMFSYFW